MLKKAGSTAVVSIKRCSPEKAAAFPLQMFDAGFASNSDKKRKLDGGTPAASNGTTAHGKMKKEMQHGKFKKNKDKRGKFGKKL